MNVDRTVMLDGSGCDCRLVLSIVVPAYQAEGSIGRLLDSILAWDSDAFEVVVVDDGSTDATGSLVASRADADSRIRLVTQSNQGRSSARNTGIGYASCEWVMFADADDYFVDGWWNCVLEAVRCKNDLTIFAMRKIVGGCFEESLSRDLPLVTMSAAVLYRALVNDAGLPVVESPESFEWNACWARLYRKAIVDKVAAKNGGAAFPVGLKFSEDRLFNFAYLNEMKDSVVVFDCRPIYCWDLGTSSTVAQVSPEDPKSLLSFANAVDATGVAFGYAQDRAEIVAMEAASQFRRSSTLPFSDFRAAAVSWRSVIDSGVLKGLGGLMGNFIGGGAWAFKPSIFLLLSNHPKLSLLLAHIVTSAWTFVKSLIRP